MSRKNSFFICSVIIVFASSCLKDKGPIIVDPGDTQVVSYALDIQPIFDAHCNGPGCHDTFEQSALLNLEADVSYEDLLTSPSLTSPPEVLVVPYEPENSVLLLKVNGTPAYNPQMPLFAPALAESQILAIDAWIRQGALNN
jgi:hypothetical protein